MSLLRFGVTNESAGSVPPARSVVNALSGVPHAVIVELGLHVTPAIETSLAEQLVRAL